MFEELRGKIAIVAGGNRGIGGSITRLFLNYGIKVSVLYHREPLALENHNLMQLKVDIRKEKEIEEALERTYKRWENIDYVINSVGIIDDQFMMMMDNECFDSVIETNLRGAFLLSKLSLPYLLDQKKDTAIVNISSIAGLKGTAGQTNYCASKAGIIAMTKSLSKEVAHKNVRVNTIAPGYINTGMTNSLPKEVIKSIPMKRMGEPEEIARIALFLVSNGASYITGETIVADGGIG